MFARPKATTVRSQIQIKQKHNEWLILCVCVDGWGMDDFNRCWFGEKEEWQKRQKN